MMALSYIKWGWTWGWGLGCKKEIELVVLLPLKLVYNLLLLLSQFLKSGKKVRWILSMAVRAVNTAWSPLCEASSSPNFLDIDPGSGLKWVSWLIQRNWVGINWVQLIGFLQSRRQLHTISSERVKHGDKCQRRYASIQRPHKMTDYVF